MVYPWTYRPVVKLLVESMLTGKRGEWRADGDQLILARKNGTIIQVYPGQLIIANGRLLLSLRERLALCRAKERLMLRQLTTALVTMEPPG